MKALVLTNYRNLELQDVPRPEPGPDEVLIRVQACGICGSDVHGYDGSTGRRIPPLVMGHEAAGIIADLGSAVSGFRLGQRVTFDSTLSCGQCFFCKRGQINLCDARQVLGVSCGDYRRAGAFAEFITCEPFNVKVLPPTFPKLEISLIEILPGVIHAAELAAITTHTDVLITGQGVSGLVITQVCRMFSPKSLVVTDLKDRNLELAKKYGATHVYKIPDEHASTPEFTMKDFPDGFEVVIPCLLDGDKMQDALDLLALGGRIVMYGAFVQLHSHARKRALPRHPRAHPNHTS